MANLAAIVTTKSEPTLTDNVKAWVSANPGAATVIVLLFVALIALAVVFTSDSR